MKIIKEPAFKTWDLGELPGTLQNDKTQGILDQQLINRPQEKAGKTGESFLEFSSRVITAIRKIVDEAPDNTVVVTHNSVYGLIKLWDKKGRPKNLDKPFRTEYTKQGSETGEHYEIKGKNGTIYICRHGETEDNKKGLFRTDEADLTSKGVKEAEELGKELSNVKISQIVASPLDRTIETAQTILDAQKGEKEEDEVEPEKDEVKEDSQEEKEEEKEAPEEEHKGLMRSTFLYMQPTKEDDPKTFASCAGCRMFLAKHEICSIHGKDVKVDADDSCGLFVRGKAEESEMEHVKASVTKEESGFVEGPVQCKNCHYFWPEKDHNDCLLFRMLGMPDYKVEADGCCNAFSLNKEKVKS